MKKIYESPCMNAKEFECENIIATSPDSNINIDKDSEGEEQLSNRHSGSWGNIWEK